MRFMRLGPAGAERPVLRADDGTTYDLSPITADIDGAFLASGGLDRAAAAARAGELSVVDGADGLRIGAPVAKPGAVICIGQNYAAHARESGSPPPTTPIIFFKHPNTVVGAYDPVRVPRGSKKTDWEVELAAVIGTRARYLDSPDDALAHVAGYAVSNDVSERDFQMDPSVSGGQWSKGKACETFNPLGPALVPAGEVDPRGLRLRSWVNDEPRQDSTTADMIFDVAYLVWHLSQFLVLDPGDVINTGTPQGVAFGGKFPYLVEGDRMALEIDGLGRQEQTLISWEATA
jgi:2,4-diketo-3-deoxy-L-fuconate hydrolase